MKKHLRPYKLIVNIPVEVDLNELLDGHLLNTSIAEIKKNIGMYLRDEMKSSKVVPGEQLSIPDEGQIVGNLHEWDLVSYGEE